MHKLIQTVLRIGLPDDIRVYPSQFREMLAKQPGLPNELFHRDAEGEPRPERPSLRVAGAKGWIGLVADPGSEQLLYDATGAAIQAAGHLTGRSTPVAIEKREFGIEPRHEPQRYWIREMAMKRKSPKALAQDVETLIRDRTLKSIEAACDRHGFDCPTPEQLGLEVIEAVRPRGLRLQTTTGVTNMWVTLVDAEISIHADLAGHWFCGNLTSRGYGRIVRPHPGVAFGSTRNQGILR